MSNPNGQSSGSSVKILIPGFSKTGEIDKYTNNDIVVDFSMDQEMGVWKQIKVNTHQVIKDDKGNVVREAIDGSVMYIKQDGKIIAIQKNHTKQENGKSNERKGARL